MSGDDQFCTIDGGRELCFQTMGSTSNPTVLLIAGLGQHLIAWHDELCDALVDRGLHIVRFDNRDVGRSTPATSPEPKLWQLATRRFGPEQYSLDDMADDTRQLIDHLDVGPVHLVGMSMGGMIAQNVAARYTDRVGSLTSIFSTTGRMPAGRIGLSSLARMGRQPATTRDVYAERLVAFFAHIGSRGYPRDDEAVRQQGLAAWDRSVLGTAYNEGVGRQVAAILKSGNRTALLADVDVPALVIHGDRDRMVHPSGGRATAAAIRGARLVTVKGMGHDLPRGVWPQLGDAIADQVVRGSDVSATQPQRVA